MVVEETNAGKFRREKAEQEERLNQTRKKYPELKGTRILKEFSELIYKYPDLENYPLNIIFKTAKIRDEWKREYELKWNTQMGDARGLRFNKQEAYDFPAFEFLKECVICDEKELGINICPNCWEKLRTALEIKTDESRVGWSGWGYECNCLNLDEVAKLIGLKKKGVEK